MQRLKSADPVLSIQWHVRHPSRALVSSLALLCSHKFCEYYSLKGAEMFKKIRNRCTGSLSPPPHDRKTGVVISKYFKREIKHPKI